MRFSMALPNGVEGLAFPLRFAGPVEIVDLARSAAQSGFDAVWCNDHLSTQRYVQAKWRELPNYYEPLISLSFVASAVPGIRLGTSVVVMPMREPVVLAKQVATLDVFTGGRLWLGLGVGAYREEFEAVRPRLRGANRGAILAEGIRALRVLFEEHDASFNGTYYQFEGVTMAPKPLQRPFPIYVGGNSEANAERAGRFGQGWLPAVLPPATIAARLDRLRQAADAAGRNPDEIDVAPQVTVCLGRTAEAARERFRRSHLFHHLESLQASTLRGQDLDQVTAHDLIGTPEGVLDRIAAFAHVGVTHLASLVFTSDSVLELKEQMQWFVAEVMQPWKHAHAAEVRR
ncbi:MAG: LLM class flavin-dependent oxidoreductase [Armatimonadota bacterium]